MSRLKIFTFDRKNLKISVKRIFREMRDRSDMFQDEEGIV